MSKVTAVFFVLIILLMGLVGCGLLPSAGGEAATLLPDLAGYNTIEGESFTDALTSLGVMATLAGQPELGAPIAAVSGVVACYQDAGAVAARVYSDQADPVNSGVVAVGDKNALLNPLIFLECIPKDRVSIQSANTIEPCTNSYTFTRDGNEFYVLYAGLTPQVCQTFCANLPDCTGH
ncbi:MAG: hypothetical protein GY796_11720 [Chloroflexi bacterium]|nr:hypothetical protein [Chloroflexota bacterium]